MPPGLLNAQQPPAGPQQQALAPAQEEGSNVTPEEQQEYNSFVSNGMKVLYDPKALPQIIESIRNDDGESDGNPVEGLANALVMLVMRVEDSALEQGQKISGDVLLHGGTELLEQMADLAQQAGVHDFDESEIETALYLALDTYRVTRQQQGKLPEDELKADMQQLVQADQAGNLEEIIPGIGEYAKNAPKPDQPPPTQRGG